MLENPTERIDAAEIDVGLGADRIDAAIELDHRVNSAGTDCEIERLEPGLVTRSQVEYLK